MEKMRIELFCLILVFEALNLEAETLRVCHSGCSYPTVQSAILAASPGDVVEIEAGEVFVESVGIPAKHGVTVRSSRWRELPPLETRIDPVEHAALLPTIRMANRVSPALGIGATESVVAQNGVDINNNTLLFEFPVGLSENLAVACTSTDMPIPLSNRARYYLRNWNPQAKTAQLSVQPDGPVIDLVSVGSAGSPGYYVRPRCVPWDNPYDWTFRGIRFETMTNPDGQIWWLVNVGTNEQPDLRMGPNLIRFHQVVITGHPSVTTGPVFCLVLAAGSGHEVLSSHIDHCKAVDGAESKGIWLQNVETVTIRNNYVSAASINIMTAGGDSARGEVVKNVRIQGNFLEKRGYMMYRQGSGAPQGDCYYGGGSGALYRRTDVSPNACSDGACYSCQADNTWAQDFNAPTRGNYLTKNLLELKDCEDCRIEGNVLRGSYVGPDAGQGMCILVAAGTGDGFGSGYHRNHDIVIRNNWCDQVYSGLGVASTTAGAAAAFLQRPIQNISVENNLITNLGRFPALSQWGSTSDVYVRNIYTNQGSDGVRFVRNTFRAAPGSTARNSVLLGPGQWSETLMKGFEMRDNIFQFNGAAEQCAFCLSVPPAESFDCSASGVLRFLPNSTEKMVRNNLFVGGPYVRFVDFLKEPSCTSKVFGQNEFVNTEGDAGFTNSANSRLAANSAFSATNENPQLLSSEGTDLGVDVDVLEMHTKPALQGRESMPNQLKLSLDVGSTQAVIRFTRPSEAGCSVRLYNSPVRKTANLIGDSNNVERQSFERSGNVVDGAQVQFLVGFFESLTPQQNYYFHIDCGSLWSIGEFRTQNGASAPEESDSVVESAAAGENGVVEYSGTVDFASSTFLPSVTAQDGQVRLRLPSISSARYVRYRILTSQGVTRKVSGIRILPAR